MQRLRSFVGGHWCEGSGAQQTLVNPATEEGVAETSTTGVDFAAALEYARKVGGPALRELSFVQRGELLRALSKLLHGAREELVELGRINAGNTRGDAKFDVDGAAATLAAYADMAATLGDARILVDGEGTLLGRSARFSASTCSCRDMASRFMSTRSTSRPGASPRRQRLRCWLACPCSPSQRPRPR